jgi:hypothetical protein
MMKMNTIEETLAARKTSEKERCKTISGLISKKIVLLLDSKGIQWLIYRSVDALKQFMPSYSGA